MGFLRALFGTKAPVNLQRGRGWTFEVVGESHYQDALASYYRKHGGNGSNLKVPEITLRTDDRNAFDQNAIRVELAGKTVGFLPKDKAIEFRDALAGSPALELGATCQAKITGGFELDSPEGGRRHAHFGIALNIRWPPQIAD
jgi:hypothetical protein